MDTPPGRASTQPDAMRLHASLIFVLFVAHARAATIHGPVAVELEKKLPEISESVNKDGVPPENASSEQELIDSANAVKDIENNLRVKAIESIPVSVVVEGDISNPVENEVASDVKRVELDLKNPGKPQRQEHETQNAVHYDDAEQEMVTTVKQTVEDTQNALKQGFQGVTQGIQNWIANNEQLSAIQASLNNLQENFNEHVTKINSTLHTFWDNRFGSNPPDQSNTESKPEIETVESHLKILENNFQTGVKALSEGVQVFATLKAENDPSSPTPTVPNNLFLQYLQLFQNTLTQGFSNVTQALQNYVGQSPNNNSSSSGGLLQSWNNGIQSIFNPASSSQGDDQSDDEGSTSRPTIWQGIQSSIQNILSPGQAQGQASQDGQTTNGASTPNRPIAQAIQNLPFVQGVVSLIQPNRPGAQPASTGSQSETPAKQPEKPAKQPEKPADPEAPNQPGSNVVPIPDIKPVADVKEPAQEPEKPVAQAATAEQPTNNNGPIKNIIQNNPIVKGISNAVQKLQASINNPEKPREEEKMPAKEENSEKDGTRKGGHYGSNNTGKLLVLNINIMKLPIIRLQSQQYSN